MKKWQKVKFSCIIDVMVVGYYCGCKVKTCSRCWIARTYGGLRNLGSCDITLENMDLLMEKLHARTINIMMIHHLVLMVHNGQSRTYPTPGQTLSNDKIGLLLLV